MQRFSECGFCGVQGQEGRRAEESERGGGSQQRDGEGAFAGRGWLHLQPDVPPPRGIRCVSLSPQFSLGPGTPTQSLNFVSGQGSRVS